jgi:hypothetical protein
MVKNYLLIDMDYSTNDNSLNQSYTEKLNKYYDFPSAFICKLHGISFRLLLAHGHVFATKFNTLQKVKPVNLSSILAY